MKTLIKILFVLSFVDVGLAQQWMLIKNAPIGSIDYNETKSQTLNSSTLFYNVGTTGSWAPVLPRGITGMAWADSSSVTKKGVKSVSAEFRVVSGFSLDSVEIRVGVGNKKDGSWWFGEKYTLRMEDTIWSSFTWDISSGISSDDFSVSYFLFQIYTSRPEVYTRCVLEMKNFVNYVTGIFNQKVVPTKFGLSQNYPNPFNPTTKIQFTVPQEEQVKLVVFNSLGQEVKILVNEEKRQGSYEVSFDASNLPSGIYFYRLQAGSFIETKKMTLLK